MLVIIHWKLNCHNKVIAQGEGASNDSLSLLIGQYLNQQKTFSFFLITNPVKQSSTVYRSLAFDLYLGDCHFLCKVHFFYPLCCLLPKIKGTPTEEPQCLLCMGINKKKQTTFLLKTCYIERCYKIQLLIITLKVPMHMERRKARVLTF